ncbi:MAG TPA: hypothetical protein VKD67_03245, partial [Acidimicrobiales bacterium]|nr:hypothetical protein [Acidimicrobiales bacterium]
MIVGDRGDHELVGVGLGGQHLKLLGGGRRRADDLRLDPVDDEGAVFVDSPVGRRLLGRGIRDGTV